MLIYNSQYQILLLDTRQDILIEEFDFESENYTPQEYKKDFTDLSQAVVDKVQDKYTVKKILIDMQNFRFVITPELQKWHNENVFPIVAKVGIRWFAIIVSSDVFASVSSEQTIDEHQEQFFTTRYFSNSQDAFNWLREVN